MSSTEAPLTTQTRVRPTLAALLTLRPIDMSAEESAALRRSIDSPAINTFPDRRIPFSCLPVVPPKKARIESVTVCGTCGIEDLTRPSRRPVDFCHDGVLEEAAEAFATDCIRLRTDKVWGGFEALQAACTNETLSRFRPHSSAYTGSR